jgi:PadR family transcriptional regulator, regulatory protein PadR
MLPEKIKGYRHLPAFLLLTVAQAPGHGAALHARMQSTLPLTSVDTGAVYRTLAVLERDGEIEGEWDTSGRGPAKKVYRIAPAGWERLDAWREDIEYRVRLLRTFLDAARDVQAIRPEAAPCPKP